MQKNVVRSGYSRAVEFILIALVFLLPLALYTGTADAIYIKQAIFNLGAVALLAVWIVQSVREKNALINASELNLPILALFVWNSIVFLLSPYKYAGLRAMLQFAGYIILYLTLTTGFRMDKGMSRLLSVALAAAALTCVYGMLQRFGIDPVKWDISRMLSFMGNPTYFAAYLAILLSLALNLFLNAGSSIRRFTLGSLTVLMFLCLLLTYTRAAWLGIGVALLLDAGLLMIYIGCRKLYRTGVLKWALLLLMVMIAVSITAAKTAPSAMKLEDRLATSFSIAQQGNVQRVIIWKAAQGIIRDHIFTGTGPGTFFIYYPRYQDRRAYATGIGQITDHAHNEFLEIASETGVIGLFLFVWLLFAAIRLALRIMRQADDDRRYPAAAFICGLTAFMIQNMTGVTMRKALGGSFFWLMLALIAAMEAQLRQESVRESMSIPAARVALQRKKKSRKLHASTQMPKPHPEGTVLLYGAAITAVILALFPTGKSFMAGTYLRQGEIALHSDDPQLARIKLDRAVNLDGYCLPAYYKLGHVYNINGDYESSLKSYRSIETLSPNYSRLHYNLGAVLSNLRRYDEAAEEYEKALKLEDKPDIHIALAEIYADAGKMDKASQEASAAVKIADKDVFVSAAEGDSLHKDAAEIYLRRGNLLYRAGQQRQAVSDYLKASKLDPKNAEISYSLGNYYRQQGSNAKAAAAYEKAIMLNPSNWRACTNLGVVYSGLRQPERAKVAYKKALAVNPNDFFARFNLSMLHLSGGKTKDAARELTALVQSAEPGPIRKRAQDILKKIGRK